MDRSVAAAENTVIRECRATAAINSRHRIDESEAQRPERVDDADSVRPASALIRSSAPSAACPCDAMAGVPAAGGAVHGSGGAAQCGVRGGDRSSR